MMAVTGEAAQKTGGAAREERVPADGTAAPEQEAAETGRTPSAPSRFSFVRPLLFALAAVLLLGAVVLGVRYWRFAAAHVSTDNAQIAGDIVQIAPQVSGTVRQVLVSENQAVKAGDLLVVLDDATYRAAVDQAKANLSAAIAQGQGAGAGVALTQETGSAQVAQAQGILGQAESSIAGAQADVARSEAAVLNARATAGSAQAGVGNAQAAVTAAKAKRQSAAEAVQSAQAQVETAQAGVRAAQAAVEAAQATSNKAERDARRYATLAAQGAVSEQTADAATAAASTARAQLEAARQQVAQAQAVVTARQADVQSARRQQEAAEAAIGQAQAGVSAAQAQAKAAQAGIRQAQAAASASRQSVHAAEARRAQAQGQLEQAQTTPKQVAVSRSAQAQAAAKIAQARAALEAARLQLGYTRLYAPVSGRVSKKVVEVGALVQPGTPLMALVPLANVWVVANFKETQLTDVRVGQRAEVDVDALPGRSFHGRVESLSAGTGATFALLPPDNATGNFTKVVQRLPVKITLDPGQPDLDRLRVGMSVNAVIQTK